MENRQHPCLKLDKVVCRRKSNPQIVVRTWRAISRASKDEQPTGASTILQYLNEDLENDHLNLVGWGYLKSQLQNAVEDGLLIEEVDCYRIPDTCDIKKQDGHDWYCFSCHEAGNVIQCNSCWRVYHPMCILKQLEGTTLFTCTMCKVLQDDRRNVTPQLLAFVLVRLKNKTSPLYNLRNYSDSALQSLSLLLYEPMDLNVVQNHVVENLYSTAAQFKLDIYTIRHNVSIAYGANSDMAELADILLKDCKFELNELRQCYDCYYLSNLKPADWFCYPCRPAHQLVYAKLKGFSYWPAKIIKATPNGYNVRFFGSFHQRAIIPEAFIRPIETERNKLFSRKLSQSLTRALKELEMHQSMIEQKAPFAMDVQASEILDGLKSAQKQKATAPLDGLGKPKKIRKVKRRTPSSSSVKHVKSASVEHSRLMNDKNQPLTKLNNRKQCWDKSLNNATSPQRQDHLASPATKSGIDKQTMHVKMLTDFADLIKHTDPSKTRVMLDDLKAEWFRELPLQQNDHCFNTILDIHGSIEKMWKQAGAWACQKVAAVEERFEREVSLTKKRQWCYNCERPAQYYCCWNTSYCSTQCQREHWQSEHRNVCRRVHHNQSSGRTNGQLLTATSQDHLSHCQ